MREPDFWYRSSSWIAQLLMPAGAIYGAITALRMAKHGAKVGVPVFCIGNYHLGGAGKTPTTLKIADVLRSLGESPFVVSRGYGGTFRGSVRVEAERHRAKDVGDEPLMMASKVPVIVSRDRAAGAALAIRQGASVVLLDDGFQNPSIEKDASFIVIDSNRGVGNGLVFPAGPLRAPLSQQVPRTDALIVIGPGRNAEAISSAVAIMNRPVLQAKLRLDPASALSLRGQRVLAFAGIGDPARFFSTLRSIGADVVEERSFPDHHAFAPRDLDAIGATASAQCLKVVTTEKDMIRIVSDPRNSHHAKDIAMLPVTLAFEDESVLRNVLAAHLLKARNPSEQFSH